MKWLPAVSLFAILFCSFTLSADNKIRILKSDWCPYVCTGKDQQLAPGYITEIIQLILSKNDFSVEYIEMNFARGLYLLERGQLDLVLNIFKAEAGSLILNKTPIAHSQNFFYANAQSQWQFENINSLSKVKFGVVNGYDYLNHALNDYIYNNFDANITIVSGSHAQRRLIKLLNRKRIDTFIDDLLVVNYQLGQLQPVNPIRIASASQDAEPIYVGVSPKYPLADDLIVTIDKELNKLLHTPKHQSIHNKYQLLVGPPKLSSNFNIAQQLHFKSGIPPSPETATLKTTGQQQQYLSSRSTP